MQNQKLSLAKRISAFFTSMIAASAASGQQSDVQPQALEEIIVTATKRAESLQDVPDRSVSAAGRRHRGARPHSVRRLPEHRSRREFPGCRPGPIADPHARHRCERRRRRSRERRHLLRRDRHERHQPVRRQAESAARRHRPDRGAARSAGHAVRRERPGGCRAHRPRAGGSEQLRAQRRYARLCDGSFRRRELSRRSRRERAAHRGSPGGAAGRLPGRHCRLHRQCRPGQPCGRLDGAGRRISRRTHRARRSTCRTVR